MPSQCYFEGDFYYATEDTSAGESPSTHPDKWQKLELPVDLEQAVALYAAASLLMGKKEFEAGAVAANYARTQLNLAKVEAATRANNPKPLSVPYRG